VSGTAAVEIDRPRSAGDLFGATFELYLRFPWLFLALAGAVVLPWEVVQLLSFVFLDGLARTLVDLFLSISDFVLVLPLVAAFHIHAVDELRAGGESTFGTASRRGMASLRKVSPAVVVSYLGILGGFIVLIVPGIYLALRWSVVAQSAALGAGPSWEDALEKSRSLTRGHYLHILGLGLLVILLYVAIGVVTTLIFGLHATTAKFFVGLPIGVLTTSFSALSAALLYFDLSARHQAEPPAAAPVVAPPRPAPAPGTVTAPPPIGSTAAASPVTSIPVAEMAPIDRLDPERWSDAERPSGWWIVPSDPERMRYWAAYDEGGGGVWSERTTKTPRKMRGEWRELRGED
jgi:hypothetical protein